MIMFSCRIMNGHRRAQHCLQYCFNYGTEHLGSFSPPNSWGLMRQTRSIANKTKPLHFPFRVSELRSGVFHIVELRQPHLASRLWRTLDSGACQIAVALKSLKQKYSAQDSQHCLWKLPERLHRCRDPGVKLLEVWRQLEEPESRAQNPA